MVMEIVFPPYPSVNTIGWDRQICKPYRNIFTKGL